MDTKIDIAGATVQWVKASSAKKLNFNREKASMCDQLSFWF